MALNSILLLGFVSGVTALEKIILMLILLTGFGLNVMYLLGELIFTYLEIYRHQFQFSTRLKKIKYLLDDWKVAKDVKKRTIKYYKLYWEKRRGINNVPTAFGFLPLSLRKEVMVDIFWEALRHSPLLADMDMPFKRSLSLCMTNEFFLPGDFIYKIGEYKHKMFFVVSGIIQVS